MSESVEERISEAIARGDFDHLPGSGKPLSRSDDGPGWWARQLSARLRQEQVEEEKARQIDQRLGEAWVLSDREQVRAWVADINREFEADLDPTEVIAVWEKMYRARRA